MKAFPPLLLPVVLGLVGALPRTFAAPEAAPAEKPLHKFLSVEDKSKLSLAYTLLDVCQEAAARDVDLFNARPTILSRQMAIWATAVFDAWAAYDEKAVGSRLGGSLRRPPAERSPANKEKAIAYASHHALLFVYPESKAYLEGEMRKLGHDPAVVCEDASKPEGVGYLAAKAVIEYRRHDGSNQFGDEAGSAGKPYSDYTFYAPVNPPDQIIDVDRWQPITFTKADGTKFTPGFLTPHWYRVKPFALVSGAQFRPGPPPGYRRKDLHQVDAVLKDVHYFAQEACKPDTT